MLAEAGLALAGCAGARLVGVFGARVGRDTFLRLVDVLRQPSLAVGAGDPQPSSDFHAVVVFPGGFGQGFEAILICLADHVGPG
ncbi:hypothetical protein [Streptomyces sp. MAI_2237]